MQNLKKLVSMILVMSLLLIHVPVIKAEAAETDPAPIGAVASGDVNESITWLLDEQGVLTISGTGDMPNYGEYSNRSPWISVSGSIEMVVIEDGITSIGNWTFYDNIVSAVIPRSVIKIGNNAFSYGDNLRHIYYEGTQAQWQNISIGSGNSALSRDTTTRHNEMVGANAYKVESCSVYQYCCDECGVFAADNKAVTTHNYVNDICTKCGVNAGIEYTIQYSSLSITGYSGTDTDLEIPATIEGFPVERIANYALRWDNNLESVTIPDSVTEIGDSAFSGCINLKSIDLGSGITTIGNSVFYDCYALASVTIPDGVISIGANTFWNCSSLTSVTIPDSVRTIGNAAFGYCTGLTEVNMGSGVQSIGAGAFRYCSSLTALEIPDSVQTIKDTAFFKSGLAIVEIPDSVTNIAYGTFSGCSNLAAVTIPDSVQSIGERAFDNCENLGHVLYSGTQAQWESVVVGSYNNRLSDASCHYAEDNCVLSATESCTSVLYHCSLCGPIASILKGTPNHAFENGVCTQCGLEGGWTYLVNGDSTVSITGYTGAAKDVTIPSTIEGMAVTGIAYPAFFDNDILSSITIPASIKSIQKGAFYSCNRLEAVYISDLAAWCGMTWKERDTWDLFGVDATNPLYYAENLYLNGELVTDLVIPDSVTEIAYYAFYGCDSLTSVTVPDTVVSIGSMAFDECDGLTDVYISDLAAWCNIDFVSLEYRNGNPLGNAENLHINGELVTDLVIPDGVTEILPHAFYGCDSLTSVTIPDSVKSIGNSAFSDCDNLSRISIGNGVITIGQSAFFKSYNASNMQTVVFLGSGVQSIGNSAFADEGYHDTIEHVLYAGSEAQWDDIAIGSGNSSFTSATRHYNATENMISQTNSCGYSMLDCAQCGLVNMTIASSPAHSFANGVCSHCGVAEYWGYRIYSDGTVAITGTENAPAALTVPGTIENLPVTSFAPRAFYNNRNLTAVTIPDSVTRIGGNAFVYCTNLKDVTLGTGLTVIDTNMFRNCTSLESIVIPEGITWIGEYAFSGCTALSAVTLPDTVTEVAQWAFYNCKNLDHVLYGGTQAQQEAMLIDGTNDTFLTATWHCGVDESSIHVSSRELCSAVALFDCDVCDATCWQAKEESEHTFVNGKCTACSLPENCPWGYAINGDGVEITGYDATLGGNAPKIPELIEGLPVTAIGNRALANCGNITSITIPETVESIGYSAFRDCAQLLEVYFGGTQEQWEEILVDSNNAPLVEALLHYLAGLLAGDIDGNEAVTSDDVIMLLLHVTMPDQFPINAEADFTGDGFITSDDVILLLLHVTMPDQFPLENRKKEAL